MSTPAQPISTTILKTVGGASSAVGGSLLTASLIAGGPITPVGLGLMIGGLATTILSTLGIGQGCGETCIDTSNEANQIESYLKQNLASWYNSPKTTSDQQTCENNFNQLWQLLTQFCGNPAMGNAGSRCISDRQRGGKFDWFSLYYDPIANATPSDAGTVTSLVTSTVGSSGLLYLGLGIVLLGIVLSD